MNETVTKMKKKEDIVKDTDSYIGNKINILKIYVLINTEFIYQ